jgi:ribosomal-protein-alanine N-acetyltransferase
VSRAESPAALAWRLEELDTSHREALLRFERANRQWFSRWVPDRGDDYFASFDARLALLLAERHAGVGWYSVVLSAAGDVLGRVNLADVVDGSAWLGYRVAEHVTGRGVATAAVAEALRVAQTHLDLRTVRAMTHADNLASQAVLERSGFRRSSGATCAPDELVYEKVLV